MSRWPSNGERGYVLLPVVLAITLVATVAFLMNREGAINVSMQGNEAEASVANYVAEAGLQHARWELGQNTSCTGYSDLPNTSFGDHSYSATVTPTSGSPVAIAAVGTLASGATRGLSRDDVKAYQAPSTVVLQPGSEGKDVWFTATKVDWNYGAHNVLRLGNGQRSLLEFDVAGVAPVARVVDANLELYLEDLNNSGTVNVHTVTNPWVEGTCTGAGCTADGATWDSRNGVQLWATAGSDHEGTPAASQPVNATGWYTWNVTDVVAAWVAGGVPNYGLALIPADGASVDFHSSDYSDPTRHPKLTVTYSCECGVTCSAAPPTTSTQSFEPEADTYIYQNSSGTNYGSETQIWVGRDNSGPGRRWRGLVKFDGNEITSGLPVGATITSATLRLYQESAVSTDTITMDVHKVTAAWAEGSITWDSSGGGSFNATAEDTATVVLGTPGWAEWALPTTLITEWMDFPSTNYGLLVDTNGHKNRRADFVSHEHADASLHPQLVIEYTEP